MIHLVDIVVPEPKLIIWQVFGLLVFAFVGFILFRWFKRRTSKKAK